jgi:hypothetical protein
MISLDCNSQRVPRLNDGGLFGQSHPHVPTQSQGHYKISEKWTTNFCSLKKWALQNLYSKRHTLQTFVVSKSGHYKLCNQKSALQNFLIKKVHPTNFCSLKKRTLQTLYSKKHTLQSFLIRKAHPTNFVVSKSRHYILIKKAHLTNFSSLTWEAVGRYM